jgi:hypothetical protein
MNAEFGKWYWVRIRDDCGFVDSEPFLFQPTLQIIDFGLSDQACSLIEVDAVTDAGNLTYQWYQGIDDSNPIPAPAGTAPTLDPASVFLPLEEYYWVRVCDDCGCLDSPREYLGDAGGSLVFVDFKEPYIQPAKANSWTIEVLGPDPEYQWYKYKGPIGDFGASTELTNGGPPETAVTSGADGPTIILNSFQLSNTGIATVTPLDDPVFVPPNSAVASGLFLPNSAGNYSIIGGSFISQAQIDAAVGMGNDNDINDPETWDDASSISFFSRGGELSSGTSGFQVGYTVTFIPIWVAVTNDCNQIVFGADDIVSLPPEPAEHFAEYSFQVHNTYARGFNSEYAFRPTDMAIREVNSEYAFQLDSLAPNKLWGLRETSSEYGFTELMPAPFSGLIPNAPVVSGEVENILINWTTGPELRDEGLPSNVVGGAYFKVYRREGFAPIVDDIYLIETEIYSNSYLYDTELLGAGEYFYIVTLVDFNNNESPASGASSIIIAP